MADDAEAVVMRAATELAEELHGRRPRRLSLESAIAEDLGIDSMARMELLVRLEERLGASLSDQAVLEARTLRDLLGALRRGPAPERPAPRQPPRPQAADAGMPEEAATLVEALERHAVEHPDRVHVTLLLEGGARDELTYGALLAEARSRAAGLAELGAEPGRPVALMLGTCREYFSAFFGVLLAGGVPVPLFPPLRPDRLEEHVRRQARILSNAQARILVTSSAARGAAAMSGALSESDLRVVPVEQLASKDAPLPGRPGPGDAALIQYTSGSTGEPKGVVLSHAAILADIRAMVEAAQATPADVFVSWLPLYHDMGLVGAWLGSLYAGMRAVIMPQGLFLLRPQRWLKALSGEGGTVSAAPNFAYELCAAKVPDAELADLDLGSWRLALDGSEAVHAGTLERFARRFAPRGFRREALTPVYGLAECSVGLAFPPLGRGPRVDRLRREELLRGCRAVPAGPGEDDTLSFVSCGRPLPGHELRVVDEAGREAGEREEGRLQFRGPGACSGYYRNPEATAALRAGDWLDTGDRAYIAQGEVYLTGRAKDLIIKGGRNIHPAELESEVERLPGARLGGVAVLGSPDPAAGTERLVVVAETRERDPGRREELAARVSETAVAVLGLPADDVVLVPPHAIPKTPIGKVRRAACRALYESGDLARPRASAGLQRLRLALAGLGPAGLRLRRRAAAYAWASYAWAAFSLLAPAVWLGVIVTPGLRARRAAARLGSAAILRAWGLRVALRGRENIPADGRCVIAANHASYLDGLVLSAVLPPGCAFVAKRELAGDPLLGPFLRRLGTLFVERSDPKAGVADAAAAAARARAGETLVVFPEGTFRREPGLRPFRSGAFVIAAQAGVPVVPVAIRGTRSALRADAWFPRRGAMAVVAGKPVRPGGADWRAALELSARVRRELARSCGEPDLG